MTANHYIFDAMAGGTVALTGLAVAYALRSREPQPQAEEVRAQLPTAA